jgi:hypothetical protein
MLLDHMPSACNYTFDFQHWSAGNVYGLHAL